MRREDPGEARGDVERRLELLRRESLLTGGDPGGRYAEWIRNTVENEVPLAVVLDIARDHDLRPGSFDVLGGLRKLTDDEGKAYFLLDAGGEKARNAVLMTYILNAGTGYEPGDFKPTPYGSAEIRRIIDRQEANRWSYDGDWLFPSAVRILDSGGALAATPAGTMMGLPGNANPRGWIVDRFSRHGGTTYGDLFLLPGRRDGAEDELVEIIRTGGTARRGGRRVLDRLLHHEEIHSRQWARYGRRGFAARYIRAATDWTWRGRGPFRMWLPTSRRPCHNEYEQEAGLEDGGYSCEPRTGGGRR